MTTKFKSRRAQKFSILQLDSKATPRKLNPAPKRSFKSVADMIEVEYKKRPELVQPYLTLSAAATKVSGKGWLNVINCRNIFSDGPNIDFIPQDSFGGKIEVWMENVSEGESFAIQFRVVCGYNGSWKMTSSETPHIETPISPVFQSIDFFIPPVDADYGMVLFTLEPIFDSYGSWVFNDVIINKVEF